MGRPTQPAAAGLGSQDGALAGEHASEGYTLSMSWCSRAVHMLLRTQHAAAPSRGR